MKYLFGIVAAAVVCLTLVSCTGSSSSGIMQISGDTYLLSRTSPAGAFADMSSLQAETIREANAFAEKQGKIAVAISTNSTRPTHGFPSFDYQFRLVDKDSPASSGGALLPRADVVIEDGRSRQSPAPAKLDLYTELSKLDDLRKRGVLTDAEFETQKQQLLRNASR